MKRIIGLVLFALVVAGLHPAGAAAGPRENFVGRFFQDVLGRTPDSTGLTQWSRFLRGRCGAEGFGALAHGFFDSAEFRTTRPQSLDGLVTLLFQTFLGRDPDRQGQAAWKEVFREGRLEVADGFLESGEFQNLLPDRTNRAAVRQVVRRFYMEILKRDPDPRGLDAWVDHVVATGDLAGAARGFLASGEFEGKALTFRDFVTILYRTFLGRDPDPQGLDAWEAVLRDHLLSIIEAGFVPSKEFKGMEVEVCESFEAALVRCQDVNLASTLSGCGTDPLNAGEAEINKKGGDVEVQVEGAAPSATYLVVYRSITGSKTTERSVGMLTTDASGHGKLEAAAVFASGDVGAGNLVIERDGSDQFMTGVRITGGDDDSPSDATDDDGDSREFKSTLVRCAAVNQTETLSGCGGDPLAAGRAKINAGGKVEVGVVGAAPSTSYAVVYRSLSGSSSTERSVGALTTGADGTGRLQVTHAFAAGSIGAGAVVLERSGSDQFMTGFKLE